MSSYAYGGDCPGMTGAYHWGAGSVGIPGALIAAGGFLDSSIDQSAEAADEFYGLWAGVPAGLVVEEAGEDGGIVLSSTTANGFYAVPFDLYKWGAKDSSSKFTATFGAPAAGTLSVLPIVAGSSIGTGAVTAVPPVGGVTNLTAAPLSLGSSIGTGAVTVGAPPAQGDAFLEVIPQNRMLRIAGQNRIARF